MQHLVCSISVRRALSLSSVRLGTRLNFGVQEIDFSRFVTSSSSNASLDFDLLLKVMAYV